MANRIPPPREFSLARPLRTLPFGVFLFSFLPYLLIFGLLIFMLRQMQQGGNRAFAFGKSKAKLLAGDTPKVTFADVAGADEAKQELEEIIDFLKDPQKFQRLGGRLPKGALLVGPPGTGKTLLAKAVAGEAGRPFFSMSGSDFVEMFVGVGASRVRDLFEQGKAHAPCIIFIDEIDAVGRHRGAGLGGGHDERERTSMVLTEEERKLTAYHEAGHALVGLTVPGIDPIHKVTIVPRGRALGITFFLPEKDRRNVTKQWLLGQLAMSYGGRVAEELVFGPDKVTTGAYSDIQQATEMARRMVTQFGMSDAIGPIAVGDREAEIFLGREVVQRREVSEHTAELVDTELKRLLGEAYERARGILTQHRDRLDRLAAALLERETLVHWGAKAGADVLTGEGWALVGVAASRLAPLGRPDRAPSGLARLVPELARFLASYVEPPGAWAIAGATLPLAHPVLIGIVNVTPDSFSDGGRFTTLDRAVAQAERLVADGAALLDVGGESTRPGAAPVSVEEEIRRVTPVVEQLARRGLGPVSVDTRKAAVARAAIAAGAAVVNDVSGLAFGPELARVAAQAGVGVILMHMRGTPDTMDGLATYRQVAE